jgi:RNA polymerase sigma-70 factor, ECF subfamily
VVAHLDDMSDDELLQQFVAGEPAAFGVLLKRYQVPIYNFIARSVRDTEAASDLLQEVFTRVIQHSGEFNRSSKFSTWLYAIARNMCIDHLRRMSHRRHASLDSPGPNGSGGGDGSAVAPWVERVAHEQPGVDSSAASGDCAAGSHRRSKTCPASNARSF